MYPFDDLEKEYADSGSYSWDHDSDSLQFASVSQERTGDSRQSPGISGQQQTPTNAGSSGSTNSARGSIGTPTRLIQSSNLAYHQTHNYPVSVYILLIFYNG
ncbi:unnamed protein product [Trichobilharzia regenti]|nr:unnamed protein product [Trichobilharzia regenti]